MSPVVPDWDARRFFLPNEDAGVVSAALARCTSGAQRPAFVGGSGMVLLEATARAADDGAIPTFVDISAWQADFFRRLAKAIEDACTPKALRAWFTDEVYPELAAYYGSRGATYPIDQVIAALERTFRVSFFHSAEALDRVRSIASGTRVVEADVVAYLAASGWRHDFIYLANVPDYLPPERVRALFAACRRHRAPVYFLLTSACPDAAAVRDLWAEEGYVEHPASPELDADNRALGSPRLAARWNRPGRVHLLSVEPAAAARADQLAPYRALGLTPP